MAYEKLKDALRPYVAGGVGSDGEQRLRCPNPDHPDRQASASVNWEKKVWHCMGCDSSGTLRALAGLLKRTGATTINGNGQHAEVIDIKTKRKRSSSTPVTEPISEEQVKRYIKFLRNEPTLLRYLNEDRGLTLDTLDTWEIGYDARRQRFTIPIRDRMGTLVNIRRYSRTQQPKMKNAGGHGDPPRLFPQDNLQADTVIVCEGEWDALLSTQMGFPAVTGTHGVGTWLTSWNKHFRRKTVYVCFDNDDEGKLGAARVAKHLESVARSVRIVKLPVERNHEDLSDWWISYNGSRQQFEALLAGASEVGSASNDEEQPVHTPTPVEVQVIGSMDSRTNGKPLVMTATITGRKNPTYSVPHKAHLTCTLDAGPKCKHCPMATEHEGSVTVTIRPNDGPMISRLIDQNETKVLNILREGIGAPRCSRFTYDEGRSESQTVEELFVTGNVDTRNDSEEADYTQRRIYNVGSYDTKTNMVANVTGTTVPSPKDRRNEFFAWELDESITSIDSFRVDEDVVSRLSVFRPKRKQSPLNKCMEIATDLGDNVTGIVGRERMHVAMDLAYHSILHFPLDGKVITRGWLEFLVVGDTRTGKSETAHGLARHYGLGHVIGCESATFAGLVGAVKQVSETWVIQWGEITINDRRLVILDEASGLSQDIIGQLSDIRSRGVAQLTKAESQMTRARCRMIWVSNPRRSRSNEPARVDGIDVIEDLIGNPEDIARFDLAMSVSASDVDNKTINSPHRSKVPHVYTSELCRELVLWAWSRTANDVKWDKDAYEAVYRAAEWMGSRYVDVPPLVQRTNVREKIARVAVALAARTFSTTDGHDLVVKLAHVRDATNFMDKLYSYENFGYFRLSQRIKNNRKIARKNIAKVRRWLSENPKLLDFLLNRRSSFRAQDMKEMMGVDESYVQYLLAKLADSRMIDKQMAQIVVTPELHRLLREMEK